MKYQIVKGKPWFYQIVALRFPDIRNYKKYVVFPVGYKIYTEIDMEWHLLSHELTHIRQQSECRFGALQWWIHYLISTKYRFEQELEAYQAQYSAFCERMDKRTDLKKMSMFGHEMAKLLCSPMYGFKGTERDMLEIRSKIKSVVK